VSYFRFPVFSHFFNMTSMEKKWNSKNDLTPAPGIIIYIPYCWIIYVKDKNWGYKKNFVDQLISIKWHKFCFDTKILKLWPECEEISNNKVYKSKNLKFEVLTPFSHFLIMLFHWNFNRQFDDVPGLTPLRNFPKIVLVFLLIFERKHKRFAVGGRGQVIFWI
jgi:hypothetical protein